MSTSSNSLRRNELPHPMPNSPILPSAEMQTAHRAVRPRSSVWGGRALCGACRKGGIRQAAGRVGDFQPVVDQGERGGALEQQVELGRQLFGVVRAGQLGEVLEE